MGKKKVGEQYRLHIYAHSVIPGEWQLTYNTFFCVFAGNWVWVSKKETFCMWSPRVIPTGGKLTETGRKTKHLQALFLHEPSNSSTYAFCWISFEVDLITLKASTILYVLRKNCTYCKYKMNVWPLIVYFLADQESPVL